MKRIIKIVFLSAVVLMSGCKANDWMDWKAQNEIWLEQNKAQEGIQVTSSGLQYKILYPGNPTDAHIGSTSTVTVKYKGQLINGKVFDQADEASFLVSQVVAGFAEGLKKMHVMGEAELYIPWDLGYGADGTEASETSSAFIPPYSTLIFHVEVKSAYSN